MAAGERDHYEVLGVERTATVEEIKVAFRKLASVHHPDRNPDDESAGVRFKEINASWQILSDPQRRAMYDRFGHRAEASGSPFAASGPFAGGVVDIGDLNFDGILGDLLGVFGVGRGDKGDVKRELEVGFEEAAFGCDKELSYPRVGPCGDCKGNGSAPGSVPDICPSCAGRGKLRVQQGLLPISVERPCARCKATGRIVKDPCTTCRGSGLVSTTHRLNVTLPPGIDQGATRLVTGAGNRPRPDKAPGDLEIIIKVRPHPFFRRVGDDVLCQVPISFPQAALGAELEVPTLDGKGKMRVPSGTQPGQVLRIKGRGIPHRAGVGRGDQKVEIVLDVPTELTARQRELLEEFAREGGAMVQPQPRTFVERLRDLF